MGVHEITASLARLPNSWDPAISIFYKDFGYFASLKLNCTTLTTLALNVRNMFTWAQELRYSSCVSSVAVDHGNRSWMDRSSRSSW